MVGKLVFVYGTLRRGDCRFGIPSFVKLVHEKAFLEGFRLLNLGSFPGIVPGKGRVQGEVHLYSTFDTLDLIEGFCEDDPESSLFKREKVIVEVPFGIELQASTYTFNDEKGDHRVIENGDWFSEQPGG